MSGWGKNSCTQDIPSDDGPGRGRSDFQGAPPTPSILRTHWQAWSTCASRHLRPSDRRENPSFIVLGSHDDCPERAGSTGQPGVVCLPHLPISAVLMLPMLPIQ